MSENQVNELIGEIAAINEEIEEFSNEGVNVSELVTERDRLVITVDQYLTVQTIKAAPIGVRAAAASKTKA